MIFEFLLALVFIGIPALFIWGIYWLGKKLQSKKTGIILASVFSVLYLFAAFYFTNEDLFFTKSDARKILISKKIILKDDFKLVENKTAGWMGDFYRTFTVKISERDKTDLEFFLNNKIDSTNKVFVAYPKSDRWFYKNRNSLRQKFPTEKKNDEEEISLDIKENLLIYTLTIE